MIYHLVLTLRLANIEIRLRLLGWCRLHYDIICLANSSNQDEQ